MTRISEFLGPGTVGPRDIIAGILISTFCAAVGMLLRLQPDTHQMVISNFGPKQIPTENVAAKTTFPMWFVVDHVSASSRVIVDGVPVPSVVDMSAHAITAMIPPAAFIDDGSVSVTIADRPTTRSSNQVVIAK